MNVQQRRQQLGWSQEQLAQCAGLSTRTIQRIESGQTGSAESLKCLAAVFQVSTDLLKQEQLMQAQIKPEQQKVSDNGVALNELEKRFIKQVKGLVKQTNQSDQTLTAVERKALQQAKELWRKLVE